MAVLVVAFKDVLFDVVVGIAPPPPVVVLSAYIGDAAAYVDIIELKPRSDVAINMWDIMLVRLTLTLTDFTEHSNRKLFNALSLMLWY